MTSHLQLWNVFAADENNSVSTFVDSGHFLSKKPKFLCVGFAPQFLVLGVHEEVPHFHEMAHGFVKDSVEYVGGVLLLSCVASHDRAACCFAMIVDAGQQNLLSYCTDLGLTAGVACRTIHGVSSSLGNKSSASSNMSRISSASFGIQII